MSDVWYFADQGGQQGPVSRQDLMAALARMPNAPDVFVWQPGFSDWKRAGDVAELNVRGSGAPPPPPMRDGAPAYRDTPMPDESNAGIARLWFGFSGRANRAKYWLVAAVNVAIIAVLTGVAIVGDAPALWIVFIIVIARPDGFVGRDQPSGACMIGESRGGGSWCSSLFRACCKGSAAASAIRCP